MLTLQEVMNLEPLLTQYGFGFYQDPNYSRGDRKRKFRMDKMALANSSADFNKACKFMQQFKPRASFKKRTIFGYSYHLKHELERMDDYNCYMPEGVLIAAGIAVGLKFKRAGKLKNPGSGVYFNISARSYRRIIKNPRI